MASHERGIQHTYLWITDWETLFTQTPKSRLFILSYLSFCPSRELSLDRVAARILFWPRNYEGESMHNFSQTYVSVMYS
jgi:hypothetical protein